jgi:uncharacterized protein
MKKKVLYSLKIIIGISFIIIGIIGIFLPILQGILFIIIGIMILKNKSFKEIIEHIKTEKEKIKKKITLKKQKLKEIKKNEIHNRTS